MSHASGDDGEAAPHHPLFAPNGKPVKFYLWGTRGERHETWNLTEGQRDVLKGKIKQHGGVVCGSSEQAETVIVSRQGLDALKQRYSVLRTRWAEPPSFVDMCIRNGRYAHERIVQTPMGGRSARGGNPRVPFTSEDDLHLCEYLATRTPFYNSGGRTGNKIYKELMASAEGDDMGVLKWALRHTWQSWRERYKKRAQQLDPVIDRLVAANPRVAGDNGKGLYQHSRTANGNGYYGRLEEVFDLYREEEEEESEGDGDEGSGEFEANDGPLSGEEDERRREEEEDEEDTGELVPHKGPPGDEEEEIEEDEEPVLPQKKAAFRPASKGGVPAAVGHAAIKVVSRRKGAPPPVVFDRLSPDLANDGAMSAHNSSPPPKKRPAPRPARGDPSKGPMSSQATLVASQRPPPIPPAKRRRVEPVSDSEEESQYEFHDFDVPFTQGDEEEDVEQQLLDETSMTGTSAQSARPSGSGLDSGMDSDDRTTRRKLGLPMHGGQPSASQHRSFQKKRRVPDDHDPNDEESTSESPPHASGTSSKVASSQRSASRPRNPDSVNSLRRRSSQLQIERSFSSSSESAVPLPGTLASQAKRAQEREELRNSPYSPPPGSRASQYVQGGAASASRPPSGKVLRNHKVVKRS